MNQATSVQKICKFCGKHEDEVERLIRGNAGAAICNECVQLCNYVLEEKRRTHPLGVRKDECWVPIANDEFVVFPNALQELDGVSYVRWVNALGVEVLYYDSNEWAEDPKATMGAMMSALMHGGSYDEFPGRKQTSEPQNTKA